MELRAEQTFCIVVSFLCLSVAAEQYAPEVHTQLGALRGLQLPVKGTESGVHAYLGVPFAKPPVGPSLRLEAPQPVEGWDGVRDATKQPLICIQNKKTNSDLLEKMGGLSMDIPDMSEDCLYLNIYTPANRAAEDKLPVMVWIHGGGFTCGLAAMYDGSALAAYQDVVVVVIQYRLGVLGFLSTGDEHMSGNFGLLDQIEALRWVKEHIRNFGGDPDLVTIFGESAGGVSVSLLLLSPLSNGLFHRAIAESGTAAMDMLVSNNPLPIAQKIANATGCSSESTEKIGDCMRNLDLDSIISIAEDPNIIYAVNVDGHFLKKTVDELFQKDEILTVPFMTGFNTDEGGWMIADYFGSSNWTEGIDRDHFHQIMSMFYPNPEDDFKVSLLTEEYIGTGEDATKNRRGFTDLLGDLMFNLPAIKTAIAHRDAGADVYLYEYRYPPRFLQRNRPDFVGSDHGDEIFMVFGFCFLTNDVTLVDACPEEEIEFSKTMMNYWASFARTGSPNGEGLTRWPKYGQDEEYMALDLKSESGHRLKKDRFAFMTQTLPEKIKEHQQNEEHAPEVHTQLGALRGLQLPVKGTESGVHAYLGVPFAKPPVGPSLRLKAPQPVEGWDGVRDATKQPLICIQRKKTNSDLLEKVDGISMDIPDMSEDCLYLNIYTPANRAAEDKLPVMVWIHGGGFTFGLAAMYDGSALAAYQDVVVVVIQYRLGVLGFLSTGDEHVSGNFGLLDQIEALRWVKEHIHNFGGDPDLVTIFGESAGGVSVSLLLLSPLSNGLFHRAIAESGTAAMDMLVSNNPLPITQKIANATGCSSESTEKIGDCMRNLDLDSIISIAEDPNIIYAVNVDGHFLKNAVDELFQKHEILTVPFMTGFNTDEGGWAIVESLGFSNWTEGIDRDHFRQIMSMFYPNPEDDFKVSLLTKEYIGTGEDATKNRRGFTDLLGDLIFNIPAIKTAIAHRDAGADVYLYEYRYPPRFLQRIRPDFVGSDHLDEIFMVLGFCFLTNDVTLVDACPEEEIEFSKTMMNYWASFARTGSPNGEGLTRWPKYGQDEEYMALDLKSESGHRLKKDRFVFMTQTLPEKIKEHQQNEEHAPEVHTQLGALRGLQLPVKGTESGVHAYLGVPFAKPPVGPSLRLKAPQPVEGWDGVRDATKQPLMCIQPKSMAEAVLSKVYGVSIELPDISEDCLYLNIYTPAKRTQDAKLPVMVWIHGGGFSIGSASTYDGSALSAYEDVVVVLIQYRLGLLGFLSTGDENMSGNFGLLDQIEALRWVKEHIHNFGGDPDLVTIFGESAGGVSVSLLLLSPLSHGLFHRAIAESGTAAMSVVMENNPLPITQMLANSSGCSIESTEKISECMRSVDVESIIATNEKARSTISVDGHFIKKPPIESIEKSEILTVPLITGVNNHEGGWMLMDAMAPPNWTQGLDQEQVVSLLSIFYSNPKDAVMLQILLEEYLGTGEDRVKNRDALSEVFGDLLFVIPATKTAKSHRDAGADVYLYEYHHAPIALRKYRPDFVGCDHGDEIFTVFGACFAQSTIEIAGGCSKEEEELSKIMMRYWANFARTGSPNGDGLVHWPKYGAEENHLKIGLTEQVAGRSLKKERVVFMTETLPEKIKQHEQNKEHVEL